MSKKKHVDTDLTIGPRDCAIIFRDDEDCSIEVLMSTETDEGGFCIPSVVQAGAISWLLGQPEKFQALIDDFDRACESSEPKN